MGASGSRRPRIAAWPPALQLIYNVHVHNTAMRLSLEAGAWHQCRPSAPPTWPASWRGGHPGGRTRATRVNGSSTARWGGRPGVRRCPPATDAQRGRRARHGGAPRARRGGSGSGGGAWRMAMVAAWRRAASGPRTEPRRTRNAHRKYCGEVLACQSSEGGTPVWSSSLMLLHFALQWTVVTMFSTHVTISHRLISQAGWNRCNLFIYLSCS